MFRSALASLALVALSLGPVQASIAESWYVASDADSVHLVLGVPDTDEASLDISCQPGSGEVTVRSFIGSNGLLSGEDAEIRLEGLRTRASFPGKALANDESGGIDVEGHGPLAALEGIVKSARPFSLIVKGARHIISPAGMADPYMTFAEVCAKP
ncbi:hypothetical protein [Ancylobacter pratisalsi]|uniref:Uncharacterized protein n=1 Tax=Ancylobacter pratisalsi TaxID=1745854 RepID=A0A6P1YSG5_9HYPH|nr:hypothetical protein [Ancylobacter pratisalsi]QIB35003.1 hypothetical protein G3A50_15765 [Ancylobacter pratisalsi]